MNINIHWYYDDRNIFHYFDKVQISMTFDRCHNVYLYDLNRSTIYSYLCHVGIDHYYDTSYFQMGQLILYNELLLNYLNIDIRVYSIGIYVHVITIIIRKIDWSKTTFTS